MSGTIAGIKWQESEKLSLTLSLTLPPFQRKCPSKTDGGLLSAMRERGENRFAAPREIQLSDRAALRLVQPTVLDCFATLAMTPFSVLFAFSAVKTVFLMPDT
ncbi:MAG: hypothetical protein LBP90_00145 [Burkholderiales bacterium]|jgi:hypothetical protein|nr:hypothetical protein [Burkholderiales bacterium]